MIYLFMIVHPQDVGFSDQNRSNTCDTSTNITTELSSANLNDTLDEAITAGAKNNRLESDSDSSIGPKPVTLWRAILIPGVIEYSMCLFFCKGVFYAIFGWLPVYIKDSMDVANAMAANISVVFDGGKILVGRDTMVVDKLDASTYDIHMPELAENIATKAMLTRLNSTQQTLKNIEN